VTTAQTPNGPLGTNLDVLLIEDSASDVELTIERLTQGGLRCRYRVVAHETEMRNALQERMPSLILSDFSLPGFDGMTALAVARELAPEVPFLFLSGTIGEERAIEALRCGAVDYILKSNPKRLLPAVQRALAEADLRRASRAAERRMARMTRVLEMLGGINTAVVRIQSRDALLSEACRLAHRLGVYPVAMIVMIDPATRTARPVASAGLPLEAAARQVFTVADSETADTSLVGAVMRSGQPAVCDDIAQSQRPISGRDELIKRGIHSLACLPLRVRG
jgi:CheY-like chemotaxis protein